MTYNKETKELLKQKAFKNNNKVKESSYNNHKETKMGLARGLSQQGHLFVQTEYKSQNVHSGRKGTNCCN